MQNPGDDRESSRCHINREFKQFQAIYFQITFFKFMNL